MSFVSSKAVYFCVARALKSTTKLCACRFFSTRTLPLLAPTGISNTAINYISNNNSNSRKGNDSNASSTVGNSADEDREELERERQLRERFATKVQEGIPNLNSNNYYQEQQQQQGQKGEQQSSFTGGWDASRTSNNSMNEVPNMPMASKMFKLWFYLIAFFFIATMLPYANPNNPVNLLRGIPWYEVPIATSSYLILLRALYSRRDEQRIKGEFEEESRRNATLTFDQFINIRYPMLFQGYSTSQAQIVAAVAACLSASKDFGFGRTILRAAGRAKDPRKSVDDIMEALHRDYAELFEKEIHQQKMN